MKVLILIGLVVASKFCSSQVSSNEDEHAILSDNAIPANKEIRTTDRVVVMNCSDSSLLFYYPFTIPDSCSKIFRDSRDNMDNDTRNKLFHQCLDECFSNPKNGYNSDTIYLNHPDIITFSHGQSNEEFFLRDKIEIFSSDSTFHYLARFYTLNELNGICIMGDEFRLKSKEFWLNGKRNETWEYYNKSGQLIHEIEYDQGRLIREEFY
jgi:hypothetical protein